MEIAFISLAVVGVTEFINRVRNEDVNGATTIAVAAVIGALVGFFHLVAGVDVVAGVTAGFAAVGVHVSATKIGGGK